MSKTLLAKPRLVAVKFFVELHALYLDWEEEGRLRPAFTVKTSGRPN
jgi:hypothetical protein